MTASESAPSGAYAYPSWPSDGGSARRPSILLGTMSLDEGESLARLDALPELTEIEDIVRRSAIAESPYFRLPLDAQTAPLPALGDDSLLKERYSHSGHGFGGGSAVTIALPAMGSPRIVAGYEDRPSCGCLVHKLSDTEGNVRGVVAKCNKLGCPICYPSAVEAVVDRIMSRINAELRYREDMGLDMSVYHCVLSAPPDTPLRTLDEWNAFRADANERIKLILGNDAGAVGLFHGFRQRDSGDPRGAVIAGLVVWDGGPHFHYIVIGRMDIRSSTLKRVREGGWVFKVVHPDDPDKNPAVKYLKPSRRTIAPRTIRTRLRYLVSHVGIVTPDGGKTRDTYTFLGTLNPRSKRGLRAVGEYSERVYPIVEGDGGDTARRFLFEHDDLKRAGTSVHGDVSCVAYSVTRKYKVYTHMTREELDDAVMARYRSLLAHYCGKGRIDPGGGRVGQRSLEPFVGELIVDDREAVPDTARVGRGSVEAFLGKLTLDDWRAIPGVYVEVVKGANGPTEKEWFERSGCRGPPELGDRWDAPGEAIAPMSATDRAIEAWRTVYRGLTFEEVDAIVNGGKE